MSENNSKVRDFVLEVDGVEEPFTFRVTQSDFGRFLREAQRDVAAAANNLLLGTCAERERLKGAFEADWGLALQLLAPSAEELTPARGVTVKKR
jgi:hypothetical protein